MKFVIESIPFDSGRMPAWLERQLVGDRLGELIEELQSLRPSADAFDFDSWFAPVREEILAEGLAGIGRRRLRDLLAHPAALRLLQRSVLLDGGHYWQQVPRSKGFVARTTAARPALPAPATAPPKAVSRGRRGVSNGRTDRSEPIVPLTATPPPVSLPSGVPVWLVILMVIAVAGVTTLIVLGIVRAASQ